MPDLKTTQQEFADHLNNVASDTCSIFKGALKLSSKQSTAIYHSSFTNALKNVLNDTFPVCRKIVGDDFFQGMVHYYIKKTPSTSPNIDNYSQLFADFIREFPPAKSLSYLADMANLEWLLHCVAEGPTHSTLDIQALAALNDAQQENIIFSLPENSYLLQSDYPLQTIWEFNQDHYDGPETIDITNSACCLFVWRPHNLPRVENLDADVWQVLNKINNKLTVAELCDYFSNTSVMKFSEALSHCVEKGWINHFILDDAPALPVF